MKELDSFEFESIEFPKIFRKTISDRFDKRFCSIFLSSTMAHVLFIMYFLAHPISQEHTLSNIAKMQQRLVKTLLERQDEIAAQNTHFEFLGNRPVKKNDKIKKKKEANKKNAGTGKKSSKGGSKKKQHVAANSKSRRGGAGRKSRSTQEIKATIGSKGLLGLLTSTSTTAAGSEVEDVLFNSGNAQKDLDKALSNLSGMTTTGANGNGNVGFGNGRAGVKGGRSTSGGSIDDLVGGLGKTKSNSIKRTGSLVVVNESPTIETTRNKGVQGRTQDGVQGIVLKHNKSIQYCYERELKRNPNLKGKISVRFTITPQGTIKNVSIVSSTLNNKKIERCVISRIRRWTDFGSIDTSLGDTTIRQVYAFGY